MSDKLPKPERCPCCGGELEHTTRTIETIGRGGFAGRGSHRKFTQVERPVHFCRRCNIVVVLHRLSVSLLMACGLSVAGEAK